MIHLQLSVLHCTPTHVLYCTVLLQLYTLPNQYGREAEAEFVPVCCRWLADSCQCLSLVKDTYPNYSYPFSIQNVGGKARKCSENLSVGGDLVQSQSCSYRGTTAPGNGSPLKTD